MQRYLSLLLLVGFAWGQDEYPYFSDMKKQLEFEQKKIIVSDIKESRQIIEGGGSEFNWLSIISEYEPTYKIAPITTEFEYVTIFSIKRNGHIISEIDFLNFVGLNSQADKIIENYRSQLDTYDKSLTNKKLVFDESNFNFRKNCFYVLGGVSFAMAVSLNNSGDYKESRAKPAGIFVPGAIAGGLSLGAIIAAISIKKSDYMKEIKVPYPVLKSLLTNEQVKSMAEAYNRKLYNDIANK